MNLIQKEIDPCHVLSFRSFQYGLIRDIMESVIPNYFENIFPGKIKNYKYDIDDDIDNALVRNMTKVYLHKITFSKDNVNWNIKFYVPVLIEGQFFMIKGVYYVPALYILGCPITVRENSITFHSLFCPITIYFKDRRSIIFGNNIYLDLFLGAVFGDNLPDGLSDIIGDNLIVDEKKGKSRLANLLNCGEDEVVKKLEMFMFDEYTKYLYESFYGTTDIRELINIGIELFKNHDVNEFINLKQKRLIFMETLMNPLFKKITEIVKHFINGKNDPKSIKIKDDMILSNFINELKLNYQYECVNGYTSTIVYKASFKNPYGTINLPSTVSGIHPTYKNKICPVSASNDEIGSVVLLVPGQKIDEVSGKFIF